MTSPKSRPLWVGTSWKMNKTLAEADSFVDELLTYPIPSGIQPFVLPPHTALARVRDRMRSRLSSAARCAERTLGSRAGPGLARSP